MSLEIVRVNRYKCEDWYPKFLFGDFKVRVCLKQTNDLVTRHELKKQIKRRLTRELGNEGTEWNIVSRISGDDLYLKNTGRLMMWKLQNLERFEGLFESIEQHEEE
jgi:hypothetical protein